MNVTVALTELCLGGLTLGCRHGYVGIGNNVTLCCLVNEMHLRTFHDETYLVYSVKVYGVGHPLDVIRVVLIGLKKNFSFERRIVFLCICRCNKGK